MIGGLLLLQLFRLLLSGFLALLFRTLTVALLILLAIILLNYRTRIDHHSIYIATATAATAGVDVFVKRAPDQECNQEDMQYH